MPNRFTDFYHIFMTCRWRVLVPVVILGYLATTVLFAGLYAIHPGCIGNARPGVFIDLFFFSAQTLSTLGYGQLWPQGLYANAVSATEAFLGLMIFAMSSALLFAKFSRPAARVLFSKTAVITQRDGETCLVLRLANQRRSNIIEAQVSAVLVRTETTQEGEVVRKLHDLKLQRHHSPLFALTWTVIHVIGPDSPLWKRATPQLKDEHTTIILTFTGLEDSFAQTVHARHVYEAGDLHFRHRFADILKLMPNGTVKIDYHRFHDIVLD